MLPGPFMQLYLCFFLAALTFACNIKRPDHTHDLDAFQSDLIRGAELGIGQKHLALTFDDGPGHHTERLLEYLISKKIPAAFFLTNDIISYESVAGKSVPVRRLEYFFQQYPKLKELYLTEHDGKRLFIVANHTVSHVFNPKTLSELLQEVQGMHKALMRHKLLGPPPWFFRHPGGNWGWRGMTREEVARTLNLESNHLKNYIGPVFWDPINGDTAPNCTDSKRFDRGDCFWAYSKKTTAAGQGIVLFHDLRPTTVRFVTENMGNQRALDKGYIDWAIEQGFEFVSLKVNPRALAKLQ